MFPPEEQRQPIADLLTRAQTVVLARAVRESPRNAFKSIYTLQSIGQLRGHSPATFEVVGFPSKTDAEEPDFRNHVGAPFWDDGWIGRASMSTDCKLYPSFQLGGLYLVFLDQPYHVKGFERIRDASKDAWLNHVRRELKEH